MKQTFGKGNALANHQNSTFSYDLIFSTLIDHFCLVNITYLSKRPISGGISFILLQLMLRSVSDAREQTEIGKFSNLLSLKES